VSSSAPAAAAAAATAVPPLHPRRLPPLDLSNLSLRQRVEMEKQTRAAAALPRSTSANPKP
jgi:hypothetical protein